MFLAAGCYGRHRHPSWGWAMAFFQARKWSLVGPGAWAFYAVWGRSKNQDCMPVAANYNSCPLRDVFFVPLLGFPLFKKKHEKTTLAFYHYEAQIMVVGISLRGSYFSFPMDSSHGELMPRALVFEWRVSCDLSKHGEFGASANIMANCFQGFLISSLLPGSDCRT